MRAAPCYGRAEPSLLPRTIDHPTLAGLLGRLWSWRDPLDELRSLSDAQLRDIGIERHRIGRSPARELDRLRCW